MLDGTNTRSHIERRNTMSERELLIQYIANLTDKEAEDFIAFLKTIPSSEEVSMLPHPNTPPQEQTASV